MPEPTPVDPSPKNAAVKGVRPVFFDPTKKRWPRLRLGMTAIGVMLSMLLGALVLSILVTPVLPGLHLPSVSFLPHGAHAMPEVPALAPERAMTRRERALRSDEVKIARERERSLRQLLEPPHKQAPGSQSHPLAIGFRSEEHTSELQSR